MGHQLSDTDPEAERVQIRLLRRASVARRLELACGLSTLAIGLARRALRRAHPQASERELELLFVCSHYGPELAEEFERHLATRRA